MERTWRDAIIRVLREAQKPLGYSEITERILSQGYYKTDGATPDATVNAQISSSIKDDGIASPFVRVSKGTFSLKSNIEQNLHETPQATNTPPSLTPAITEAQVENSESIIKALGMYWQRELVVWQNNPRIYGKQQATSKAVNFGEQKGIYILYDHHTAIYVGRSIDRPIGRRLYEHTIDRLGGRWNRFSWFGLLTVTHDSHLREAPLSNDLASVIGTLEAILIEALEPPQNRKRGDDFSAVEYIQDVDPELKEQEIRNTLRAIEQRLRSS